MAPTRWVAQARPDVAAGTGFPYGVNADAAFSAVRTGVARPVRTLACGKYSVGASLFC